MPRDFLTGRSAPAQGRAGSPLPAAGARRAAEPQPKRTPGRPGPQHVNPERAGCNSAIPLRTDALQAGDRLRSGSSVPRATGRPRAAALVTAALLTWASPVTPTQAQPIPNITASDFTTSDYYDPPHETQVKWRLRGAEAQPQADGRFLIRQASLETFRESGERDLLVEAPECTFDSTSREAYSGGRLRVQTGEGRFEIEGGGVR